MYVHVSQVTDYDRVGRWQIPPSWPKREEEGPRGDSRGLHGGFTRRSEAVAVVRVGLEMPDGGSTDSRAATREEAVTERRAGVPAVGEAAEPAEAFVSRCAMGAKHGVRRRSRLARSTREAQGSQLARAPQLGRRL